MKELTKEIKDHHHEHHNTHHKHDHRKKEGAIHRRVSRIIRTPIFEIFVVSTIMSQVAITL